MFTVNILNRWNGEVIFAASIEKDTGSFSLNLGLAVKAAVVAKANLSSANLSYADLRSADLRSANLSYADLRYADLRSADLSSANLSYADLSYADLSYANLRSADLSSANLSYADLRSADLRSANLSYADLSYADLRSAKNLDKAKDAALVIAQTRILPDEGDVVGWKKCLDGVIVKLLIKDGTPRSHAFGRKCRAKEAKVLDIISEDGRKVAVSQHDRKTEYRKGRIVKCDNWSKKWTEECAGGIHFFITKLEAQNY